MMVIAYFDSSQHSKMMGYGSMFVNAGGILFSALAGVLATVAWRYSFYVHLILGVPFILGLFLKKPPERDAVLSGNVDAPPKNEKMNIAAWLYAIGLGVTMLFIYPFFAYASAVIEEKGLGGSVEASYFIITTAITGIVVGLIFAKSYKLMRRRLYPVSSAIIIVGLCVLVASKSLAALLAAAVLVSFGFYHIMTGVFVGIGEDVPGKAVAAATGITVAFMNAFSFIGPYILTFLSGLIGRSDSNVTPFYFAIGYFVIVGAATLFIRKKEAY
jgi:MFS family permease